MNLWHFLSDWHPKLVQFPLVLLLAGLLFDLAGLIFRSARAHWAALILTAGGTLSLLFAFICGIYAEIWAGRSGVPHQPIELHEFMANVASWGFVLLFAWRILLRTPRHGADLKEAAEKKQKRWTGIYAAAGLVWYLLLVVTAYLGGQLVFAYGAGVTGAVPSTAMSLHDLNILAARQTDKNLWYSEWMHHIFGWMTLGLAASLLAQALFPKSTPRLKWIVPAFLMAGGIFLFFRADSDLYAFTDPRQWRDREVQLHKSLALIMTIIGVIGFVKIFRKPKATEAAADQAAKTENPQSNSKLVAVLALIGGALLFTHVHTVAPYANVAAGVYIAHVFMGVVALSIGAARLLQDYLPRFRRGLALAFAFFMGVESVLLITYNEGLPWFIGYGAYDRWGPGHQPEDTYDRNGITVAPFGDFRALLYVDQKTGRLIVFFRKRFDSALVESEGIAAGHDDVTLTFDAPPVLVIGRGGSEIALPLIKSVPDGASPEQKAAAASGRDLTGSNFRIDAEFVKRSIYLNARLILKIKGREHVGYFDPWVTTDIKPVPPNELARFVCPMHEGVRAMDDGLCPLCEMELTPIRPERSGKELHDPVYRMEAAIEASPGAPNPRSARLVLTVMDEAKKGVKLARVHEQLMHLFVMSEDLSYFDHLHPTPLAGDRSLWQPYFMDYVFPRPGRYLLFADVTPEGDREQVFRTTLTVDEKGVRIVEEPARAPTLTADATRGKLISAVPYPVQPTSSAALDLSAMPATSLRAELFTQPRTPYAGLHAQLLIRLSDPEGKPISNLMPYLGAAGHCVIVSEDTRTLIHSHPEQFRIVREGDTFGPDIAFHATFPHAGTYRIWAQFRRGEQLIVAPFTIKVENPPVPASLLRFLFDE